MTTKQTNKGVKTSQKKRTKKKNDIGLKKPDVYEIYKLWKSLPTILKGLSKENIIEQMGIEDEQIISLLQIKTQGEFGEKYGMSITGLTKWNKKMKEDGIDPLAEVRKWAADLTKNVTMAHYNKLIRKFDPISGDLWYKVIAGFNEKKLVEMDGKLSLLDLANKIEEDERKNRTEKTN